MSLLLVLSLVVLFVAALCEIGDRIERNLRN